MGRKGGSQSSRVPTLRRTNVADARVLAREQGHRCPYTGEFLGDVPAGPPGALSYSPGGTAGTPPPPAPALGAPPALEVDHVLDVQICDKAYFGVPGISPSTTRTLQDLVNERFNLCAVTRKTNMGKQAVVGVALEDGSRLRWRHAGNLADRSWDAFDGFERAIEELRSCMVAPGEAPVPKMIVDLLLWLDEVRDILEALHGPRAPPSPCGTEILSDLADLSIMDEVRG